MQLLKFTESKYKPNVGEIFSQYECTFILNKDSCQTKSGIQGDKSKEWKSMEVKTMLYIAFFYLKKPYIVLT